MAITRLPSALASLTIESAASCSLRNVNATSAFFTSKPLNYARADATTATCDQSDLAQQARRHIAFFIIFPGLIHGARPFLTWIVLPKNRSVNDSRSCFMICAGACRVATILVYFCPCLFV